MVANSTAQCRWAGVLQLAPAELDLETMSVLHNLDVFLQGMTWEYRICICHPMGTVTSGIPSSSARVCVLAAKCELTITTAILIAPASAGMCLDRMKTAEPFATTILNPSASAPRQLDRHQARFVESTKRTLFMMLPFEMWFEPETHMRETQMRLSRYFWGGGDVKDLRFVSGHGPYPEYKSA